MGDRSTRLTPRRSGAVREAAWLSALAGVGVVGALAITAGGANAAASAKCPLKSSSSIPPGDAWAFHDSGAPSSAHPGITSSYVHGRGDWGGGRGSGTICLQISSSGGASHNIVLTAAGPSHLSPGVTRLGHRGVELMLRVSVAVSDDPKCPTSARGSVTIFASYYEQHHDSVQLRFAGGCAAYSATFEGSQLIALIAENGRQVN